MKKRIIISIVVLSVITFSFKAGFSFGKEKDDLYRELEIFSEGLAVIEKKYVEDKSPQDLIYGAMSGMMLALDSYSQFLTPDDYKNLLVETEGKFGGLGVEITIKDGLLTVVSPIEDTPAWEAGIKAGDIVIKIDGELTKNITLNEAVKKMRGDPGTEITLTILREEDRSLKDVTIVRAIIKIQDIKRAVMLEDNVGYVRIAEFREETFEDLKKSLTKLKQEGLSSLIIDVRNNPGGLLSSAIDISSLFIENGKTVPGSIEVTVYADEPLSKYNIGLTDFTVPGFKGAPQFETFYARSKTPMTGGFTGMEPVVEESIDSHSSINLNITNNM